MLLAMGGGEEWMGTTIPLPAARGARGGCGTAERGPFGHAHDRFELDPANGASTSRPSSSLVALAGGGGGGGSDGGVRASVARGDSGGHSARGTWMDR